MAEPMWHPKVLLPRVAYGGALGEKMEDLKRQLSTMHTAATVKKATTIRPNQDVASRGDQFCFPLSMTRSF